MPGIATICDTSGIGGTFLLQIRQTQTGAGYMRLVSMAGNDSVATVPEPRDEVKLSDPW